MLASVKRGPTIPAQIVNVPDFPCIQLKIYGTAKAQTLTERMEQGFVVLKSGTPTARRELTAPELLAVNNYLQANFPEHAKI